MSMPFAPNTTCDITRHNAADPVATGVPIHLTPDFANPHMSAVVGSQTLLRWTHVAMCDISVDIRDGYSTTAADLENSVSSQDVINVPQTSGGTAFDVIFVERVGYGTAQDYLRVYLQRRAPGWPTQYL